MFNLLTVGSKADNFAVWSKHVLCVSVIMYACMHVCMDTNTVVLAYNNNVYWYAHNMLRVRMSVHLHRRCSDL